ncbi:MAG: hypothetical protein ACQEXQ_28660 [Bacillota bacterium]
MKFSKSKLTLIVSVAAIIAVTTSVMVAFGSGEEPNIDNAALIREEKLNLDEILKKQSPDKYPNGLDSVGEVKIGPAIDIYDGTIVNIEERNKKINGLSDEKKKEYTKWIKKGESSAGIYRRKLQQILGDTPDNEKRITLSEVNNIISKNHEFEIQKAEIEKIHGTPDFFGGSGTFRKEYWLDDEGEELITVLDGTIFHQEGDGIKIIND